MRRGVGILGRRQRQLLWTLFLMIASYAPFVAYQLPDDSWMLSIAIAGVIAAVIIIDDTERRRAVRPERP